MRFARTVNDEHGCGGRVEKIVAVQLRDFTGNLRWRNRINPVKTLLGNPARLHSLIGADWANPPLPDTLRWMLEAP